MTKKEKEKEEKEGKKPFTSMFSQLSKIRKKEKKDIEYHQAKKQPKTLQEKQEETRKARRTAILKGVGGKAEQISSKTEKVIMSIGKLGKPKVKLPSYSSTRLLKQMGRESGALVREVPPREFVEDNRSLFFKEEFNSEMNRGGRWLLR